MPPYRIESSRRPELLVEGHVGTNTDRREYNGLISGQERQWTAQAPRLPLA